MARIIPIGIIEVSHFTGSVVGAALLVLSHGLARRLDAAYLLALTGITLGIAASLLKGIHYEEALALTLVLLVFCYARPSFDRRAAFFDARFSTGWLVAIAGVLGASVWIGLFAFRHVEYRTSSGGNSDWTRKRRDSCAGRSAQPCCCCS